MGFELGGALLSGGASLLGGYLEEEAAEDRQHASHQFQREMEARNEALQREFAQHGIRWRVEDAKAAGLHPLYALGGAGASYSPSAISVGVGDAGGVGRGVAAAGQEIGRAMSATLTAEERAFRAAQLEGAKSTAARNYAEAAYINSKAAREAQEARNSAPFPSDVVTGAYSGVQTQAVDVVGRTRVESHPLFKDAVKLTPDEMVSRDVVHGGHTSGRDHPWARQFTLPGGFNVLLPATAGGGVPEEIDFSMLPLVLGANLQRYGWRWLVDLANYATGASPAETRAQDRRIKKWLRGLIGR